MISDKMFNEFEKKTIEAFKTIYEFTLIDCDDGDLALDALSVIRSYVERLIKVLE